MKTLNKTIAAIILTATTLGVSACLIEYETTCGNKTLTDITEPEYSCEATYIGGMWGYSETPSGGLPIAYQLYYCNWACTASLADGSTKNLTASAPRTKAVLGSCSGSGSGS